MARYWSTPIKRVASKVAMDTRVVLAVRRLQSAGKSRFLAGVLYSLILKAKLQQIQNKFKILTWTWLDDLEG